MGEQLYSTEKIITALQHANGLVTIAARNLGCSPQTIYNRAKKVNAVQQAIEMAREELVDRAELALRAAVMDKEAWAVSLVLKTLGKGRGYVERTEQQLHGELTMVVNWDEPNQR